MEVWDPGEEKAVLSRIKKLIFASYRGLKGSRYLLYPGILLIFLFLIFSLLPGCASMKWPWEKDVKPEKKEFICTKIDCGDENIEQLILDEQNTIACIKLQPECVIDQRN
jgi:hypothetical protein